MSKATIASNLVKWLKKMPQPVAILCDQQRVEVPRVHSPWREVAQTVLAIGPSKITALAADGSVLRAQTLDADEDEGDGREAMPQAMPDLQVFARLISDAYTSGANAQRDAYRSIFEENTKLVKLLADRLGSLEVAWQHAMQSHAQLMQDVAAANARAMEAEAGGGDDEGQDPLSALASGFLAAQNGANAVPIKSRKG
jgi:hypothetical protein